MDEKTTTPLAPQTGDNEKSPNASKDAPQKSPSQQQPLTDNERRSGTEQSEKIRRSNLAGDEDTEEPVEAEEGRPAGPPA